MVARRPSRSAPWLAAYSERVTYAALRGVRSRMAMAAAVRFGLRCEDCRPKRLVRALALPDIRQHPPQGTHGANYLMVEGKGQ